MPEFSDTLIHWYKKHHRKLPWRETNDAYRIWVSEIVLQQTQVKTGQAYYERIIKSFPTVVAMANTTEDELLKHWQGLGYYSRARNMHHAAKTITNDYKGVFPNTYSEIIKLKGIGIYTAAAIASFAFNEAYAVVDGNVYRLLSRYFNIKTPIDSTQGKKNFQELANQLLNTTQPAMHNQAIMELGALVCKPNNPLCHECPICTTCLAKESNSIDILPVKSKKIKQSKRYLNYILILNNDTFYIRRRSANDIWKGLYELPLIETKGLLTNDSLMNQIEENIKFNIDDCIISFEKTIVHKLSHQLLHISFVKINTSNSPPKAMPDDYHQIKLKAINKYAYPKPITDYLKKHMALQ